MLGCWSSADESETGKVTNAEWPVSFAKEVKYMDERPSWYTLASTPLATPLIQPKAKIHIGRETASVQSRGI